MPSDAPCYDADVHDPLSAPLSRGTFRATISGVGRPGPIEERVGRRLVRLVDPESKEGLSLLRSGQVTIVGPEGAALGCCDLSQARRLLRERLESRLSEATAGDAVEDVVRDGLARLASKSARLGRS